MIVRWGVAALVVFLTVAVSAAGPPSAAESMTPEEAAANKAFLVKATAALKAVQHRVREDRILGSLAAAKILGNGRSVEITTDTPESWPDFPSKLGGPQRGFGRLTLIVFATLPEETPWAPFMPPSGCYLGHLYLVVPDTPARVLMSTVTSDPEADRRLARLVIEECAKAGITARPKDPEMFDRKPLPARGPFPQRQPSVPAPLSLVFVDRAVARK